MENKINFRIQIFIGAIIIFAVIAGSFLYQQYVEYSIFLEKEKQKKVEIEITNEQVKNISSSKEELEIWKDTKAVDIWGTPIKVELLDGTFYKGYATSAGPDKFFDTKDDIASFRIDKTVMNVGVKVGETGADLTKGILKGVHKSIFKKKD